MMLEKFRCAAPIIPFVPIHQAGLGASVVAGATGAAGRLAGGVGALVYTLHCPELEAPFLGVWYVIGMAIPAVIGAALGPRLLRW